MLISSTGQRLSECARHEHSGIGVAVSPPIVDRCGCNANSEERSQHGMVLPCDSVRSLVQCAGNGLSLRRAGQSILSINNFFFQPRAVRRGRERREEGKGGGRRGGMPSDRRRV
jgi:hypothetical protein